MIFITLIGEPVNITIIYHHCLGIKTPQIKPTPQTHRIPALLSDIHYPALWSHSCFLLLMPSIQYLFTMKPPSTSEGSIWVWMHF